MTFISDRHRWQVCKVWWTTGWGRWVSYPRVYPGSQAFWQTEQWRFALARVFHHNCWTDHLCRSSHLGPVLFLVFINDPMTYQTTLTSSLTFTLKIHCEAPPHYLPEAHFKQLPSVGYFNGMADLDTQKKSSLTSDKQNVFPLPLLSKGTRLKEFATNTLESRLPQI